MPARYVGGNLRVHPQHPGFLQSHAGAFYRIFLRHQQCIGIWEVKIGSTEAMMIGERVRYELQAKTVQVIEEALRIADAGDGMKPLAAQLRDAARICRRVEPVKDGTEKLHGIPRHRLRQRHARRAQATIQHNGIEPARRDTGSRSGPAGRTSHCRLRAHPSPRSRNRAPSGSAANRRRQSEHRIRGAPQAEPVPPRRDAERSTPDSRCAAPAAGAHRPPGPAHRRRAPHAAPPRCRRSRG